jgi:hypothetical protein
MSKRLVAYVHGTHDPAARFRIAQYMPLLSAAGWEVSLRPQRPARPWDIDWGGPLRSALPRRVGSWVRQLNRRLDIAAASNYDCVFQNRDLLGGRAEYEEQLFRRNHRVVFDFDDAIFLGGKADHIGGVCARAAWVIAGNAQLAAFARQHTERVSVIPTVVDPTAYEVAVGAAAHRAPALRVGWLGSAQSIEQTLFPFVPLLATLQARLGFEFVVMSSPLPVLPDSPLRWRFVPWSPLAEAQIARHLDIGIMPLVDEPYQRGKCGCKLLQYMAAGLPTVASPVGVNVELLGDGARGFAASTPQEWGAALEGLMADAARREAMGRAGRSFVSAHYSVQRWFPDLLAIIEQVSRRSR